ncbi:hypothetical protein LWI29_025643 [Acer saccharum]|uniref:CCHC-type domain-containing protein n=1 Tax=Acer saccharum TaxID=4024 RepID=A0AA39W699_ACESA|nr:hypothetical protein LWI29_025643 [Acer saccharum]
MFGHMLSSMVGNMVVVYAYNIDSQTDVENMGTFGLAFGMAFGMAFGLAFQMAFGMVEAYSGNIFPVGHPSEWTIPEDVRSRVVYPPPFRAQAGRPKEKRFKSAGEHRNGKTRNCTIYGKYGHNRQNCRNAQPCQIPVPFIPSATLKRQRRPYRCRKYGEEGHSSKKCPLTSEVGGTT